jgi:2-polyprenyl-6-methoxyphenol hydroxylase-like FAD-dependent oxidoreductase
VRYSARAVGLRLDRPVLVVGSGIGGLTATLALRRAGLPVELYERAPELLEIGTGITIQPNAVLALRTLGLDGALLAAGRSLASGRLLRWDGRRLVSFPAEQVYRRVGAPAVGLHRGTLQRLLLQAVDGEGPRLGRTLVGYETGRDGVTLRFAGGGTASGPVLVGADGLNSAVRAQLLGDGAPVYAGYTAWRGVARESEDWSIEASSESWGRGRRFGMVPIDGGRIYWYATLTIPRGGRDTTRGTLLDLFRGWHDPIQALLEATPQPAILRNDIFDRPPSPRWGEGPVTLLGDAAHPMTPNLGQGACQAIEDAVVLARCLAECDEPESGLRRYEERRRARANAVVVAARRLGRIGQWESPLACRFRDALFAALPFSAARRQLAESWTFKV